MKNQAFIPMFLFLFVSYGYAQKMTVKDSGSHILMEVNDEGTVGSIMLRDTTVAPSVTSNKLYNINGTLYFNGSALGTAVSAGGWTDSNGDVYLATSGDKVGIGDSSPTNKLDVAGKIGINDTQILYLPNQTDFTGTLILGNGGGSLDHSGDINNGRYNTASGIGALNANTNGYMNTAYGYQALYSNISGQYNEASGSYALYSNTSGTYNMASGSNALRVNTTGSGNTASGYGTLYYNITGYQNTANGCQALSANTSGYYNMASGAYALYYNTTGYENTASGYRALFSNTTGNSNTALGFDSNLHNQGGSNNTVIGYAAGRGTSDHNKSGNVFIGYQAGYSETGSNLLYIDNSNSSSPLIWGDFANNRIGINGTSSARTFFVNGDAGGTGDWNNDSDGRMKKNVETIPDALNKVLQLRGVNFEWKETEHHEAGVRMGFIAQEAEGVIPEVVSSQNDQYSMQYAPITALLVEAVKEQQKTIADLRKEIEDLKNK